MALRVGFVGLLAGLVLASPAQAASELSCIDTGYADKDVAALETFYGEFKIKDNGESAGLDRFVQGFAARAGECAGTHGWSVDALTDAVFYRTATVLETALLRHAPLSAPDMAKMEAAFARADKARIRAIFGPMIEAEANGTKAPEIDQKDAVYIGMLLMSAGVPMTDETGEFAGALIAARVMKDMFAEKFAAQ